VSTSPAKKHKKGLFSLFGTPAKQIIARNSAAFCSPFWLPCFLRSSKKCFLKSFFLHFLLSTVDILSSFFKLVHAFFDLGLITLGRGLYIGLMRHVFLLNIMAGIIMNVLIIFAVPQLGSAFIIGVLKWSGTLLNVFLSHRQSRVYP